MKNNVDIREKARELFNTLRSLQEALLYNEEWEISDELEEVIKILYFYSIFPSTPLFSVVGPQGVGKSQMVNTLLNLREEEALPVGETRCEQIPVVLLPTKVKEAAVEVYKWSSFTQAEIWRKKEQTAKFMPIALTETLSYAEARERVVTPLENDAIVFWHIKDNPILERIHLLAVLPGFELKAPWEKAVKGILDISDVVIYTVDWRRKAQASAQKIENWMKEAELPFEPIVVFTKSDTMNEEQKESVKEGSKPFEILFVGTGEKIKEEYENLWGKMIERLINLPPQKETQKRKIKNLLLKIRNILNKVEKVIKREETEEISTTSRYLDEYIEFLDEEWKKVIEKVIIGNVESILNKRIESSIKYARRVAEREFGSGWEKFKLWFTGGPSVKKVIEIENALRKNFLNKLGEEISEEITKELRKLGIKEKEAKDIEPNWTMRTFIELLTAPLPQIEYKMEEMAKDIKESGRMSEEMIEFLKGRIEDTKKLTQTIIEFKNLIGSENKGVLLPSVISTAGVGTSIAEATGALTATPAGVSSVIVGVGAAVVAVVAGLSIYSSVLRSSRRMEWEIERYIREYTSEMYEVVKNNFIINLNEIWEITKFRIKKKLIELMGLRDKSRNRILLSIILKDAKEKLISIKKEI